MANITLSSAAKRPLLSAVSALAIAISLAGCSAAVRDCMHAHRAGIAQDALVGAASDSYFDPTVSGLAGAAYLATGAGIYVDCLRRPPAPPPPAPVP